VLVKTSSITLTQGGFDKLNHCGIGFQLLPKGGFDKLNHRGIGFRFPPQGGFDRLNHRGIGIRLLPKGGFDKLNHCGIGFRFLPHSHPNHSASLNYIIFDLEATCWENTPIGYVQEIIEIGALLVDDYGQEIERFNAFVRPSRHPNLSPYCKQLTGITQIDVNRAKHFPEVVNQFMDWAEIDDDDYILCSWGEFDQKMLAADCRLHGFGEAWLKHYVNLKGEYRRIKRLPKGIGLKKTVEIEGFEFTGDHHRAISDAENLAKVFVKYLGTWELG
jgi:3'-5' exoribonuclease 1